MNTILFLIVAWYQKRYKRSHSLTPVVETLVCHSNDDWLSAVFRTKHRQNLLLKNISAIFWLNEDT